jgi:hypothetical protein
MERVLERRRIALDQIKMSLWAPPFVRRGADISNSFYRISIGDFRVQASGVRKSMCFSTRRHDKPWRRFDFAKRRLELIEYKFEGCVLLQQNHGR